MMSPIACVLLCLCIYGCVAANPRLLFDEPCPDGCLTKYDHCFSGIGCPVCSSLRCKLHTEDKGFLCPVTCPAGMHCNSDGHCMEIH